MIERVGSCGETKESTAARVHQVAAILWRAESILAVALAAVGAGIIVVGGAIIAISRPARQWHDNSVATHTRRARAQGEHEPTLFIAMLLALALVLPGVANAHPGRLGKDGCHVVRAEYRQDGRVLQKGERHCHRPLGEMRLDGRERLDEAPTPAPKPPAPARTAR